MLGSCNGRGKIRLRGIHQKIQENLVEHLRVPLDFGQIAEVHVQGDGGLAAKPTAEPMRPVPIDVLSQYIGRAKAADQVAPPSAEEVDLKELGPPFDDLRQRIEHAALLGLPILLRGDRGTGKTFLAQYYHNRRQSYRNPSEAPIEEERPSGQRLPENAPKAARLVTVTLSEFVDVDNLRDTLFGWAPGSWGTSANRASP